MVWCGVVQIPRWCGARFLAVLVQLQIGLLGFWWLLDGSDIRLDGLQVAQDGRMKIDGIILFGWWVVALLMGGGWWHCETPSKYVVWCRFLRKGRHMRSIWVVGGGIVKVQACCVMQIPRWCWWGGVVQVPGGGVQVLCSCSGLLGFWWI